VTLGNDSDRKGDQRAYLSVWSLYQDEAPYIREWIEFHRLMGVERFFLYDHYSADDHLEQLAPYLEDGIVVLYEWPIDPGQVQAANHCLEQHRDDSRWIAFIDLDEFLFSPTGKPLPEVLAEYEEWPGVVVNVSVFGTSGHELPPGGLVIENYTARTDNPGVNGHKKSIVDPSRVESCRGGVFDFSEGHSVNENKEPSDGRVGEEVFFDRLRINHYHTKSRIEFERKVAKPRADRRGVRKMKPEFRERVINDLNEVPDDALVQYGPAVRQAIAATEERWRERHRDAAAHAAGNADRREAVDPQALAFARDVLAGVVVCAEDGEAYPHPDLAQKAVDLLDPKRSEDERA
jgi:hypothetical protein